MCTIYQRHGFSPRLISSSFHLVSFLNARHHDAILPTKYATFSRHFYLFRQPFIIIITYYHVAPIFPHTITVSISNGTMIRQQLD